MKIKTSGLRFRCCTGRRWDPERTKVKEALVASNDSIISTFQPFAFSERSCFVIQVLRDMYKAVQYLTIAYKINWLVYKYDAGVVLDLSVVCSLLFQSRSSRLIIPQNKENLK